MGIVEKNVLLWRKRLGGGVALPFHHQNCTRQTPTLRMDKLFVKFVVSGTLLLFGIVSILLLTVPIHELREPPQYMVNIITYKFLKIKHLKHFVFLLSFFLISFLPSFLKLICMFIQFILIRGRFDFGKLYKLGMCCFEHTLICCASCIMVFISLFFLLKVVLNSTLPMHLLSHSPSDRNSYTISGS